MPVPIRGNRIRRIFALVAAFSLAACGGGGGGDSTTPSGGGGVPQITYYTLGGTVSGLVGSGLVLKNGFSTLTISGNGSFTLSTQMLAGATYNVTVQTQPTAPAQTCQVTNGSGTINGNVSNIQVVCGSAIGGTVSGLSWSATLQNNGGDNLSGVGNGSFTFATLVPTGSTYSVSVLSTYYPQVCTVVNGSGTASANVTDVQINCRVSIGGTVSGLKGSGLVLRNNGADDLTVPAAAGTFTFPTTIATGGAYDVTVAAHPSSPAQTCTVANGSGTAGQNITTVQVTCIDGQWTWMGGATVIEDLGNYGVKGTPAAGNQPPARYHAVTWTDLNGSYWLFGGTYMSSLGGGQFNDLWKYDVTTGMWTWVSGANIYSQKGVYGTKGAVAAGNVPGAREGAITWTGATGELWLFGGTGYDSTGAWGYLNDLWKYNITSGMWTWVGGSNVANVKGTYGTKGTGSTANIPGGRRSYSSGWADAAGNLWVFAGYGYDSAGTTLGQLNDLWKFNPGTGQWTWMSGTNLIEQGGVYGTQGVAAATNMPGGRSSFVSWTSAAGDFWLFGGYGVDSSGTKPLGDLNDLWKFSTTTNQWTWIGGSDIINQGGSVGAIGVGSPTNMPGAREGAVGWADGNGNLWLFGGSAIGGYRYDLWKYGVASGQWTWVSGNSDNWTGTRYATIGAAGMSVMGVRTRSATRWIDGSGNLWLFGGYGNLYTSVPGASQPSGVLNDLWRFTP